MPLNQLQGFALIKRIFQLMPYLSWNLNTADKLRFDLDVEGDQKCWF